MYEIYLTDGPDPARVAELLTVDDDPETATATLDTNADALELCNTLCVALQPYLRDGVEAHFVTADA
jgi:hypothetical protein